MQVVEVPIDSVSPNPANVRLHSDRNVKDIAASLRRFGQQTPIVVDMNNIIRKGNGTWLAAKELGWKAIQVRRTDLEGPELVAYEIADNRTGETSQWDWPNLAAQVHELEDELKRSIGFTDQELRGLNDRLLERELREIEAEGNAPLEDGPGPEEEGNRPAEEGEAEYRNFSMALTIEQDRVLRDAIREAKSRYGAETTPEAVYFIMRDWLDGNN